MNSLGMKFVPVPITGGPTDGQKILFSVWDTRVQDYQVFAKEAQRAYEEPPFSQGPTDPIVNVSWDAAVEFCKWLSKKEGRTYRLPSDHEWSCAVGIGRLEKAEDSPETKSAKIKGVYPWGTGWPPPKGAGNYNQRDQVDEFEYTSPVGSFAANQNGLYDLGGNVSQWCEDWTGPKREFRALRGGDYIAAGESILLSSRRWGGHPSDRRSQYGFRCVLAVSGG